MTRLLRSLLAGFWPAPLAAGLLMAAAFPPLDLGFLAPLAWALLLASMRVRRGARAGRQGFVAGLCLFLPGLHWMQPLMDGGWLFSAAWCALFPAALGWFVGRVWLARERAGWVVGAALVQLACDGVRTYALSGFPWLLPGYTGWRNPVLLGSAGLLGVHGATLAVLLLGGGIAEALVRRLEARPRPVGALVPAAVWWGALALFAALAPAPAERPGPTLALLQGNVPQKLKHQVLANATPAEIRDYQRKNLLAWWQSYEALADEVREGPRGREVDVVVWPETMVPPQPYVAWRDLPRSAPLWERLAELSGGAQTLAGVVLEDDLGRQWNSVVLLDAEGRPVAAQDKQHLTPGGEYVPYVGLLPRAFRAWLEARLREFAGFVPELVAGDGNTLLPVRGRTGVARAGVLICYESVFPEIARGMVRDGADFLLNASNYGWFEGTAEMDQALAMACFRAAELGVPVALSSNNGHSTVIGADGRPRAFATGAAGRTTDVRACLVAEVPLGGRATPFRTWGEWPAWGLGLVGLALGLAGRGGPWRRASGAFGSGSGDAGSERAEGVGKSS